MVTAEYQRFTLEDHRAGRTGGWRFAGRWYRVGSVIWGWFWREVGADG